jgi:hypothetical protein
MVLEGHDTILDGRVAANMRMAQEEVQTFRRQGPIRSLVERRR